MQWAFLDIETGLLFRFGLDGPSFGPLLVLKLGLYVSVWVSFSLLGFMFINLLINNIIDGKKKKKQ